MENIDHDRIVKAYWDLRKQVQSDPEYARLTRELEKLEIPYEAALSNLSGEDRLTVERYLLLRENRNLRMVEYALSAML